MAETFQKEALQFTQSGRRSWTTTFTLRDLTRLLPPRPPEQLSLFTETNRPINRNHLSSLARYIRDTPNWALPPLVLSAVPGAIQAQNGTITVPPDAVAVLDGQHRLQAFAALFNDMEIAATQKPDTDEAKALQHLASQELAATIIEVQDNAEHRQIFAWLARTRPIDPATREYFDNSDPYSKAAKTAMESSATLSGRVLYTAASLPPRGSGSRSILTLRNLKELTAVMHVGITKPPKPADREVAWQTETQEHLVHSLVHFFDTFLPKCKPNCAILDDTTALDSRIASHRSQNWALHVNTIRLIGNCWARWTINRNKEESALAETIGNLNFQIADPANEMQNTLALVTGPRLRFEKARSPAWDKATTHILALATDDNAQGDTE